MRNRTTRSKRTFGYRLLLLVSAVALVAAACGSDESVGSEDALDIVVTTSIWADVVENIVGDDANVEALIPIGGDPHDYAASSQQVASIQTADLVIANGLALEEGLLDVLEAAEADGVNVLELGSDLEPIPFAFESGHDHGHDDDHDHEGEEGSKDEDHDHEGEEGHEEDHDHEGEEGHEDDHDHEGEEGHEDDHDHEGEEGSKDEDHDHEGEDHDHEGEEGHSDDDHDHGHSHDGDDPHVWMDPDRVAMGAMLIAAALAELDDSIDWESRATAYADEVRAAGAAADDTLAAVATDQRKLVTNHEALGYFADRFDFEVVGVVIPGGSTLADPSSSELAELVETMEAEGVRVIFGETSSSSDLAEAVAAELGEDVEVVTLYTGSLGEEGSGADTVIGMVETNAGLIAGSLGG